MTFPTRHSNRPLVVTRYLVSLSLSRRERGGIRILIFLFYFNVPLSRVSTMYPCTLPEPNWGGPGGDTLIVVVVVRERGGRARRIRTSIRFFFFFYISIGRNLFHRIHHHHRRRRRHLLPTLPHLPSMVTWYRVSSIDHTGSRGSAVRRFAFQKKKKKP